MLFTSAFYTSPSHTFFLTIPKELLKCEHTQNSLLLLLFQLLNILL